jgi:hypothetical protein
MAWYAGMISNLSRFIAFHSLISSFYQCTIVPMRINVWRCIRPSANRLLILYNNLFFFLAFFFCFRKSFVPFEDCVNNRWTIPGASRSICYSSHCSYYALSYFLSPLLTFYYVPDRTSTQCASIATFHGKLLPATCITTISTLIGMLVRVDFDAKVKCNILRHYTEFRTA